MSPNKYAELFFLDPSIHFLNHGSFGATPRPVMEVYQNWQRQLENQPVEFLGRKAPSLLAEARSKLAHFLGTKQNNLVFIPNATTGINIVARSLNLKHKDGVISSNHEYGAIDRTWFFLSQKYGFQFNSFPIETPIQTASQIVDSVVNAITGQTRVLSISHITSPTALIFPLKEICKIARAQGILTVVDGAHAPGQIDIELEEMDVDFYIGNLHKWLCAPKGSAFLFANPRVQPLIEPLIVSWGWQSEAPGPSQFIDYLEWTGTRDISPFLSVPAALDFHTTYMTQEEIDRCHKLAIITQNELKNRFSGESLTDLPDVFFAQMSANILPGVNHMEELKIDLYDRHKIEIPLVKWLEHTIIRASFQIYNSEDDASSLFDALTILLKK
jgi:isopenicillin-N epimerase